MKRTISIEIKMIVASVFFTLLIVTLERYQFSENIVEQFVESKQSKNRLLIDTIAPIISLNLSLGLDEANQDYLDQIINQNRDVSRFELIDPNGKPLYRYVGKNLPTSSSDEENIHFCTKPILDPISGEKLAVLNLELDDREYRRVLEKNRETTLKIFGVTLLVLIVFITLIRQVFRSLKQLSENVSRYNPYENNFVLDMTKRDDEVGVIHNAIVSMVKRIAAHSKQLDEMNHSLEEKILERTRELENANHQLQALSITDPLTQLYNRRHFQNHIDELWELARRNGTEISLVMCDIDHFKEFNDRYGHIGGDIVLKETAQILKNSLKRASDFAARYGGEEFVIVLYDTTIEEAGSLCHAIGRNLAERGSFEHEGKVMPPITLSFGIASMVPDESTRYEQLVKSADELLYQAKLNGRNRVVSGCALSTRTLPKV
ncbi:MAG: diguanylate cyclase [Campylobacterales bacterium]|nr:diguanylate cyclase [Campylobacterales bacterium]